MDEPLAEKPLTDVAANTPSLRTAHILFMDIVGFSKLRTNEQVAAQVELQQIVQEAEEVRLSRLDPDGFIARPTGDGMALIFYRDQLSPIKCALQIHTSLKTDAGGIKQRVGQHIKMRMGIHTGAVTPIIDMNGNEDASGEGIITAQRVMDAGDAEHILVSEDVAKVLLKIEPWSRYLHDLGTVRVKHKQPLHLYNLVGRLDGPYLGNRSMPAAIEADSGARRAEALASRGGIGEILRPARPFLVLGLIGIAGFFGWQKYGAQAQESYAKWQKEQAVAAKAAKKPSKNVSSGGKSNAQSPSHNNNTNNNDVATNGGVSTVREVPDLTNLSLADAKNSASGDNFRVVVAGKEFSDVDPGSVARQSPRAGGMAKGSIQVWLSKGSKPDASSSDDTSHTETGSDSSSTPDDVKDKEGGSKTE
jgi:class 3 adenylate cyclase